MHKVSRVLKVSRDQQVHVEPLVFKGQQVLPEEPELRDQQVLQVHKVQQGQ